MTGQNSEDVIIREKDLPQKFILKILGHCETTGLWGIRHTRIPVDNMVTFAKNQKLCLPIVQLIVTKEGIFILPLDYQGKSMQDTGKEEVNINVVIPKTEVTCVEIGKPDGDGTKKSKHRFRIKAHFRIVKKIDRSRSKVRKKFEDTISGKAEEEDICKGCGKAHRRESSQLLTDVELLEKYKRIDWQKQGIAFYPIDNISYGVQDLIYTRVFSMIEVAEVGAKYPKTRAPFTCHSFVCESHNTAKMLTYSLDAAFQAYGKTLKNARSQKRNQQPKN